MIVHCNHKYTYLPNSQGANPEVIQKCSECGSVKRTPFGLARPTTEKGTLCEVVRLEPKQLSLRTQLAKHRIILRAGSFITRYFAQKKALEIAYNLLLGAECWDSVYVEVPFKQGVIQARLDRDSLEAFLEGKTCTPREAYSSKTEIERVSKQTVLDFAKRFSVCRVSMLLRPGGRAERWVVKLRGYKNFYR